MEQVATMQMTEHDQGLSADKLSRQARAVHSEKYCAERSAQSVAGLRGQSRRRQRKDRLVRAVVYASGALVCLLLVALVGYIVFRGVPGISAQFLTGQTSYLTNTIGILPNIANTLYLVLLAIVIVVPFGVGAAIYLHEYAARPRLVGLITFAVETLTGVPSVIFGLVGMLVFIQILGLKAGILAGALTVVVMVLPTIILNTLESLKAVPDAWREGSLALGSGKWHMVRTVVLPNARRGIVTGVILAIGRMVGESAALLYTAGFGLALNSFVDALQISSATLTVALYVYATERAQVDVAFSIATVLLMLTLLLNMAAHLCAPRQDKKEKAHE